MFGHGIRDRTDMAAQSIPPLPLGIGILTTLSSFGPGSPAVLFIVLAPIQPSDPSAKPPSWPYVSFATADGAVVTAPVPGSAATAEIALPAPSATATTPCAPMHPPTPGRSGHVHAGDATVPSAPTRWRRSSRVVRSVTHVAIPGSTHTPPPFPIPDRTTSGRGGAALGVSGPTRKSPPANEAGP